jgi:hypothetical protein
MCNNINENQVIDIKSNFQLENQDQPLRVSAEDLIKNNIDILEQSNFENEDTLGLQHKFTFNERIPSSHHIKH